MNVGKFPSRRVMSRRPRRSKNGTPEERVAKAAAAAAKSTPANVVEISRRSIATPTPEELKENKQWLEIEELVGKLDPRRMPAVIAFLRELIG